MKIVFRSFKTVISVMLLLVSIQSKAAPPIVVTSIADLQNAISKAVPGDVILVEKGVYKTEADITINKVGTAAKPITIAAKQPGTVEIAGAGGFSLESPAAYIIIKGFTFTHAANKAKSAPG